MIAVDLLHYPSGIGGVVCQAQTTPVSLIQLTARDISPYPTMSDKMIKVSMVICSTGSPKRTVVKGKVFQPRDNVSKFVFLRSGVRESTGIR